MITIKVNLLGEGRMFDDVVVDSNITHNDFRTQIEILTAVPPRFQVFYIGEVAVQLGEYPMKNFNNGDHISVKHLLLNKWNELVAYFQCAQQAKEESNINETIKNVAKVMSNVDSINNPETKFFLVYPTFKSTFLEITADFMYGLDTEEAFIHAAVESYYIAKFGGSADRERVAVSHEEKTYGGMQGGIISHVRKDGESLGRYFVKVHTGLTKPKYSDARVDLREFVAYKILDSIGFGPALDIIPNVHFSACGLYISTIEIGGFTIADRVSVPSWQMHELDLLCRLLQLGDMNTDNYGIDAFGKLWIVDFTIVDQYDETQLEFSADTCGNWLRAHV